jgi:DNA-binding transcriptional ArsR family regulator
MGSETYDVRMKQVVRDVSSIEYEKMRFLFMQLGSKSAFHLLQFVVEQRLIGEKHVYRQAIVDYLQETYGYKSSRISNHLKVLKEANFLQTKRDRNYVFYGLNDEAFRAISKAILTLQAAMPGIKLPKKNILI